MGVAAGAAMEFPGRLGDREAGRGDPDERGADGFARELVNESIGISAALNPRVRVQVPGGAPRLTWPYNLWL
jgi:hypothetical protein